MAFNNPLGFASLNPTYTTTKLTSLLKRQAETSKTSREFKMIDTIKNILGHFGLFTLIWKWDATHLSLVATAIATIYMIVEIFREYIRPAELLSLREGTITGSNLSN